MSVVVQADCPRCKHPGCLYGDRCVNWLSKPWPNEFRLCWNNRRV